MVYPLNTALLFTNFLLDINTWRYTNNGNTLITTVQTAASTGASVSDADWKEYTQYTEWRYATFIQHNDLSS